MKKILEKIFVMTWLFFAFVSNIFANNTQIFDDLWRKDDRFIRISTWNNWYDFLIDIANSLINIFFIIAFIYFFIIVIKLLFAENSEEESSNFKKWFIWVSLWLMVMQISRVFVNSISSKNSLQNSNSWELYNISNLLLENIIKPLTSLLETGASFIFILIAIYAFYKLITSNWDENAVKNGRNTILYSIIWFVLIKVSTTLINAIYWKCEVKTAGSAIFTPLNCERNPNVSEVSSIIITIINWINSFVWIWIIIMIIFAWLQIIFSKWDEEKINSWKKSIIYIVIWICILVMNYFIVTFFNLTNINS